MVVGQVIYPEHTIPSVCVVFCLFLVYNIENICWRYCKDYEIQKRHGDYYI